MRRLHLLGFTQDLKGIVFSQRRGGKTASFWLPVDERFREAVDKLDRARRERDAASRSQPKAAEEAEEPAERVHVPAVGRSTPSSRLPVGEIQQLLREGRTVKSVAEAAKTSQEWVERLAEPVLAERAGVVQLAQLARMPRARLGPSGLPLGEAVRRNLEERRATTDTLEALDAAWDARASHSGVWRVWVRFDHRGKRRTAEWYFRKDRRQVQPRNRLGAELGWWPPEEGAEPPPPVATTPVTAAEEAEGEDTAEAEPRKRRRPAARSRARKARRPTRKARPSSARSKAKRSPRRRTSRRAG